MVTRKLTTGLVLEKAIPRKSGRSEGFAEDMSIVVYLTFYDVGVTPNGEMRAPSMYDDRSPV